MSRTVSAAAVQFTIALGDIEPNLAHVRQELARLASNGVQLVVLPEMWATGFAYKQLNELAQRTASLVEELATLSRRYGMVIVGSLTEPHEDKVYNNAYLLDRGELKGK